jgi:hypothetical protein
MNFESISVFAINATVVLDVTPTGNPNYIISLDYNAGTAIDRIQNCNDFRLPAQKGITLNDDIFYDGCKRYITYSFVTKSNDAVYILTCDCSHQLTQVESYKQIKNGMDKAFQKLEEICTKSK